MKLGDVLRKERELKEISFTEAAARLGIGESQYQLLENGNSPIERWGPLLGQLAIILRTPTSRLVSVTGRANGAQKDSCGSLIRQRRETIGKTVADVAQAAGLSVLVYEQIERGSSPLEEFGPLLLRFAEMIEQPVFNLFYPCALPLEKLEDYP